MGNFLKRKQKNEKDISAAQCKAKENSRVLEQDGHARRKERYTETESKRPQETGRVKDAARAADYRLTREHRLRKGDDIRRVMNTGVVHKSGHFIVFIADGEGMYSRLGLAVG